MKKKEETTGEGQTNEVKLGEESTPEINDGDPDGPGKPEQNDPQIDVVNLKGVVLKGTDSQKTGPHTLFIGSKIVNFVDGKADVQEDIAEELENGGYIE